MNLDKTKVLVTGAAGFIGSHSAEFFVQKGINVLGVDNLESGRIENLCAVQKSDLFGFEKIDVASAAFTKLVQDFKPTVILHMAGLCGVQQTVEDPDLNFKSNVHLSHCVAEAARRARVSRLVFASSSAVYGNTNIPVSELSPLAPLSPYAGAKAAAELLLQSYGSSFGMIVRVQRYFNVYGSRQSAESVYSGVVSRFILLAYQSGPLVIHGDGTQTRDFIHVSDVARANYLAAISDPLSSGVANICTGIETPIKKLAQMVQAFANYQPQIEFALERPAEVQRSCGLPTRALSEFGFHANIKIESGLREMLLNDLAFDKNCDNKSCSTHE